MADDDRVTNLAESVLGRLTATYPTGADPARAAPMTAYMRGRFPFLGITTPQRRALSRVVVAGLAKPAEPDLRAVALACWALPEREYQYFAADYLRAHASALSAGFLPVAGDLVTTKPWWDTVDILAAHVVGAIVGRDPAAASTMDEWAGSADLWLVRTAILHQLRSAGRTDRERLFGYCAAQAGHRDFFVRKAIGWALREYAKTDPDAVRRFVGEHPELSGLSIREALKNLKQPAS